MPSKVVWLLAGLLVAAAHLSPVAAQVASRALSATERNLALKLEQDRRTAEPATLLFATKSISKLKETASGRNEKSVIAEVTLLGSPGTTRATERRAMVTRYDYATGLTVRTTVDLNSGNVVDVKADANRPTPVAPEEKRRAVEIAGAAVPALRAGPPERVRVLSKIQSNPNDPRYGHRLVILWQEQPSITSRVLVDLSTEEIANPKF